MRPIIMRLDMLKVSRILKRGVVPIEVLHPLVDRWVVVLYPFPSLVIIIHTLEREGREAHPYSPNITLKMPHINRVEPHDRRKKPHVRFC